MRGMQVCMPSTDTVKELAEEAAKPTLIFDKAMNKMEWQAMQVPSLPGQSENAPPERRSALRTADQNGRSATADTARRPDARRWTTYRFY